MKAYKIKTVSKQLEEGKNVQSFPELYDRGSLRIQAVYYSSKNPSQHLLIYDADGDMCLFPIPGQDKEKVIPLPSPITVRLPIYYIDEAGEGNEIIIFGELLAEKLGL